MRGLSCGYFGIVEKNMETTIVYCGYIGIMDKKMVTTILYWGYIGLGFTSASGFRL